MQGKKQKINRFLNENRKQVKLLRTMPHHHNVQKNWHSLASCSVSILNFTLLPWCAICRKLFPAIRFDFYFTIIRLVDYSFTSDLEKLTAMLTHMMNICAKFHWNASTK